MRATALEFRLRVWIIAALYLLGFLAPWEQYLFPRDGSTVERARLWSWLAFQLYRTHWMTSLLSFQSILAIAILLAAAGAVLRVWGTACLGVGVVSSRSIIGAEVVAAGPYRYVRNPLYLGLWLTAAAVSILMPHTGGLFFLVALAIFEARLILSEEAYLDTTLGGDYRAYQSKVPRLIPRLRSRIAASSAKPRWLQGLAAETYPIGIALCLAIFGWTYDAALLTRCVLICFGASLVIRAAVPGGKVSENSRD